LPFVALWIAKGTIFSLYFFVQATDIVL
jgi:hypothetical protein